MCSKALFYLLLVLSLCALSVIADFDTSTVDYFAEEVEQKTLRLPNDTWPISYDIHIKTNIHKRELEYTGTVSITLIVKNDTNEIVLHAGRDMDKFKISLVELGTGLEIDNLTYSYDNETTFLRIYSETDGLNLKSGSEYLLTISYVNYHSVDTKGFYKLVLNNTMYRDLWFAVTHFEATYARQVFPCYDEPAFKAKFLIRLTHGSNYTAISNMPADGEPIVGEDETTTLFQQTPPMSTYGVAFAVIIHEALAEKKYNVLHRIFSVSDSKDKGHFALDIATESLEKLENFFDLDYPLPKMDHISVEKREGRGMENWGLTIYEDGWLLLNSESSVFYNMSVAVVIVHEMAHQWFGNLVSPKWWTYTWLNEGLASFYSYKVIESLHPEWQVMDYAKIFEMGLATWRLPPRLKLTQYVETEREIEKTFGYHAYFVAAFMLQMFEAALTEKTFQKGVSGYLHKYQYSVAEEDDLFEQLQIAATEDKIPFFEEPGSVKKAMKTWSNQIGIPTITVVRNYDNGTITLYQEDAAAGNSSDKLWWIPITIATAKDPNFNNLTTDFIFPNTRSYTVNLTSLKEVTQDDWIILNKQQLGPFRINYDERNWNLIIEALKKDPKSIHSHSKAQLIQDATDFVESGRLSNKTLIQLLSYLKEEDDAIPWFEGLSTLNELKHAFKNDTPMYYFNYFGQDLIRKVYRTVGIETKQSDVPFVEFIRLKIFEFACMFELEECLEESQRIFDDVFRHNRTVEINQRSKEFIYAFGFDKLSKDDFHLVIDFLLLGNDTKEKLIVVDALSFSRNLELVTAISTELNITPIEMSELSIFSQMRKLIRDSQLVEEEST